MADTDTPDENRAPLARPSTAFQRPPGNTYIVTDDGPPLDDTSQRPTIIAPVEPLDLDED